MRYRNAMQRDPNLARAFDNLAGLFAPPSGSDFLASAKMQSERADAERRALIFSHQDPAVAAELAARMGIANYGQTQSGFGKTDATNRRGQDIERSTKLDQTRMQQEGELARLYATPRAVGQNETLFVPQQTQRATGFGPTMMGIQERDPGKAYVLPDGTTAMGPAPTLSLDQRKGEVFATLPQEQQQAAAFGNTPVETIIMDGQPKIVARRDALGQSPVPPAGDKGKTFVDASGAPVVSRPDGSFSYTDGRPLPPDAKLFNVPTPTGSQQDVGMGTTANKSRAQAIRGTVANADRLMADIDQTIRANPASAGVAANIVSFGQDVGQVFKEFGERFGNPNTPVSIGDLQALAARVAPGDYNPVYRRVRAQLLELAYTNARLNNPSGEVSRYSLEREIEALGLGTVGNDQAVLAVLDASRGRLRRSLAEADVLEGTARPPTPDTLYAPQQGQPAQPGAPQQPRTRMRFDANGNPVQ